MPLRCLLFCADAEATPALVQVLADLQIDAEHCPNAITATERITSQPFQIVILDWDDQPDAGLLLNTARTRKASERPLTLAIVGEDSGVPKALQAGANSILRKPILVNHVRDTLTTARDLLRAKLEQSTSTARTIAAKPPARPPVEVVSQEQPILRAGEFLQSSSPQPGAQFTTESDLGDSQSPTSTPIDPLKDLEPMAATLETKDEPVAEPAPAAHQPRGLAWYKARSAPKAGAAIAAAPALAPAEPRLPEKSELLGYGETHAFANAPIQIAETASLDIETSLAAPIAAREQSDQKTETQLFAYMAGEQLEKPRPAPASVRVQSSLSRAFSSRTLSAVAALGVLAACAAIAYWALPQKLWRPGLQRTSNRTMAAVHAWLNPQPVAPAQAPVSHENFGRAGDEYKLPVAEAIPDATTDPSQIHVVPVVDPTAKHPSAGNPNGNSAAGTDATSPDSTGQTPVAVSDDSPAPVSTPGTTNAGVATSQPPSSGAPAAQTNFTAVPIRPPITPTVLQRSSQPQYTAVSGIPSSLKSQMASSTPEAGGNKAPEAAMPSIEPVSLPESTARNLLLQQAAPLYPDSAKGQSGTVVLQVLVGRDGTVQDAKFLQGSLVFARAAIEAVKQWRFQPYTMNGRPVSTVTSLTVSFKPAS